LDVTSTPEPDLPNSDLAKTPRDDAAIEDLLSKDGMQPDATATNVRYVFVTAAVFDGNLGGLSGADEKCRQAALAGGLPNASSAGSYKAWLTDSDPMNAPVHRFNTSNKLIYVLPDAAKSVVAVGWTALTTPPLARAIDVTETGGTPNIGRICNTFYEAFTNTYADGTQADAIHHCVNWTSNVLPNLGFTGSIGNTNASWSKQCATACPSKTHLYCFQQ
jgi:hypothetical protein